VPPQRTTVLLHALKLHEGPLRLPAGNFVHTLNLACALANECEIESWRLLVLVDELGWDAFSRVMSRDMLVRVGVRNPSVVQADRAVVKAVRTIRPNIYHRPTGQLPFSRLGCRTVASIADLNFRWLPTPLLVRVYKEISYRWTVRVADRITCVSEFTRLDAITKLQVRPMKIRAIHHGTPHLDPPEKIDGLPQRYWLTFAHQAHKNVEVILRALNALRREDHLLVVGASHYVERVLKPMVQALHLESRVQFLGRISSGKLTGLYRNATGLLFISRFEGFGLPVLEAMSSSCPVIASNVCSLPEVGGDAILYVDPDDVAGLAEAMGAIIGNPSMRSDLAKRGVDRAASFTWHKAAKQTLEVYRTLV
jgi:glycosyltransferase involved in cell wall biosynthesis